jgi:lipopolysaccharide transport system permease protein
MRAQLAEFWEHKDLTLSFAVRDIKARYKQTALGAAWAMLQPLSLMVAFTLVFSRFAQVPSDGVPYPIFSYSALIFWTFFATAVSQGTAAIVANSNLVRKIYFPRETLLVSILLAAALDLSIAAAIFAAMLAYYHVAVSWTVLWVPVLLLIQTMFALAVICVTSAIHVSLRDIGHGIPLLLQLWMFATPIAYPLKVVPASLLPIYMLNPMAPIIDGYRRTILLGQSPDVHGLLIASVVTLLVLTVGYSFFKRAETTFADVI